MTRALIRGNEVMTEPFSPWVQNNIPFLTGTEKDSEGQPMKGDGWVLVTDYNPELSPEENVDLEDEPYIRGIVDRSDLEDEVLAEMKAEETVRIGNRTYTISELKTLLN